MVHDTYPGVSTCQRAHHSSSLCNYKRQYIEVHTCTSKILYSHPRPPQIMEVAKPTVSPTTHSMVPALDCLPPTISASAPNFFLTLVCLHRVKRPTTQDCIARKLTHLLSNALSDVHSRNGSLPPSGGHRSEGLSVSGPMADTGFAVEVLHTR